MGPFAPFLIGAFIVILPDIDKAELSSIKPIAHAFECGKESGEFDLNLFLRFNQ